MDVGTLIGIVVGFGLIIGSIMLNGSLTSFMDLPSFLIVVGGTVSATLIMEKMQHVVGAMQVAKNAFLQKTSDVTKTIQTILELSNTARREGILALESVQVEDPFLAKGLRMAVDGIPREEIRETLTVELISMKQRHTRGQKLFKFAATTAPSMGMIGTLIGLVQMLQTLDDPASIGPSMAVALLTTMYGAVLAFLVAGPISEKLARRSNEESANMTVIIEGIDSIVKGHNAAVIKDKLEARLSPKDRTVEPEAA
ncbi:MAG TPA: MotA/TolQ/ExbB proton channel family protein [Polyangiaceae bacterium]|nr:MotA/TolQ/ExbB proton channel family protein [Polyangiaceae bacterium]HMR75786.1 MotA/TolQ/ExbB proton channel family protein [Polyangiaceae bacterium]